MKTSSYVHNVSEVSNASVPQPRVVVIENEPDRFEDRLAQDVIELMTVFSARLYGRRSHQNRKRNVVTC